MKKEFIPYEQALALKELGFNEPCFGFYNNADKNVWIKHTIDELIKNIYTGDFEAPTFSQAFRWFRDNYKLQTRPVFKMIDETEFEYSFMPNDLKNKWYKTYEEAELECLKKLIEIVKEK